MICTEIVAPSARPNSKGLTSLNRVNPTQPKLLRWLAQEGGRAALIERLLALTTDDMHEEDKARVARLEERWRKWEAEGKAEAAKAATQGGGAAVSVVASALWGLTNRFSSLVLGGGNNGEEVAAAAATPAAAAKAQAQKEKRKPPPPPLPKAAPGLGVHLLMPDRGFPLDSRETPLMAAILRGDEASVLALLEGPLGANVNALTIGGGMGPLHACALEGRATLVPWLTERGADPFVRNHE